LNCLFYSVFLWDGVWTHRLFHLALKYIRPSIATRLPCSTFEPRPPCVDQRFIALLDHLKLHHRARSIFNEMELDLSPSLNIRFHKSPWSLRSKGIPLVRANNQQKPFPKQSHMRGPQLLGKMVRNIGKPIQTTEQTFNALSRTNI
jgi:hypothetical protein